MSSGEASASIDRVCAPLDRPAIRGIETKKTPEGHTRRARFGVVGRQRPRPEPAPDEGDFLPLERVLPRQYFLWQLYREKRRTYRTAAPLSIALLQLPRGMDAAFERSAELVETINECRRETDTVGSLGDGTIAILLPDTNEQGAKALTERIVRRAGIPPAWAVTVTYPDQLFDKLIVENQGLPDFSPVSREEFPRDGEAGYPFKRVVDVLGAVVALILFAPVMLVAALAVVLTSPGPAIYRQMRLGKNGKPFVFYKFRSMHRDANDQIHKEYVAKLIDGKLAEINEGTAAQPYYKLKSDPRVTRVGKFIRDTHIDELPQFFNVLKGDMSLVGPRPPVPYEVEMYQPWHLRRILEIKPGITGLWQVDGHNTTTFDEMVRIDMRYIRNCSLFLDLSILLRTVKVVLKRVFA